jgi:hypothetical protein
VPFEPAMLEHLDPPEAAKPHAFTSGGSTGKVPWSGGGPGGGPKGNQGSGSMQKEVVPEYDSDWGGPFSNADAWVIPGTGIVDVHRDYVTSSPGDQGNGWWISSAAASALEVHEQRHVASSKSLYAANIQPVLDRIGNSAVLGKGKTYKSSVAKMLLKRLIGWEAGLKSFVDDDKNYNGNNGQIDSQDIGASHYPRPQKGPRKIAGKDYDNYLVLASEPDPAP